MFSCHAKRFSYIIHTMNKIKYLILTVAFFAFVTSISGQSYVDAKLIMESGESMDLYVKSPFPHGKFLKHKKGDKEGAEKMRWDDVEYIIFLPGTDSEVLLKYSHQSLFNYEVTEAKKSKHKGLMRVIGGCENIQIYESIYSLRFSGTNVTIYGDAAGSSYLFQRNGEKYPTNVAINLDPERPNRAGMTSGWNLRYMSKYFEDEPQFLDRFEDEKVTINALNEIVLEKCN